MLSPDSYQSSIRDFEEAHFQAALRDVLARLTRRSQDLLSYEEVAEQLHLTERSEVGIRTIPIAAIVGSVGRASDFTRDFLPRRPKDMERWARVRSVFLNPDGQEIPPIEVYQVGEVYFVLDGNHRVSIARREGIEFIEARVIEIHSPVPLTPDITPEDLICQAEYADFVRATGLDANETGFDLHCYACGQYPKLLQHITVHQRIASREQDRTLTFPEAAADWLARVYAPLVTAIREQGLLRWFPTHTETDLFIWVVEHQQQLQQELGWAIRPDAAINDLAVRSSARARSAASTPGAWRDERLSDRYLERLFNDVLVPLRTDPGGWTAFDQALVIAQRENAAIHALHVVRSENARTNPEVETLHTRLHERCNAAGVQGELAIEAGDVAGKIRERALLADLVILQVSHPPAGVLSALTSRWRTILKNAARPILAVTRAPSPLTSALLVFDGSPRAHQALFIAAYMAEQWRTALTVLGMGADAPAALNRARAYLELHELTAAYIPDAGTPKTILDVIAAHDLDLILLGNDTHSEWQQMRGRSVVSHLLRHSPQPVLICQ